MGAVAVVGGLGPRVGALRHGDGALQAVLVFRQRHGRAVLEEGIAIRQQAGHGYVGVPGRSILAVAAGQDFPIGPAAELDGRVCPDVQAPAPCSDAPAAEGGRRI